MSLDLELIKRHIEPSHGCPECQVRELISEVELLRKDQGNWFAYLRWKAEQEAEWKAMLARSAR